MRREEVPQNIIRGYAGGGVEIGIIGLGCGPGGHIHWNLVPVVSTADQPVEPYLGTIVATGGVFPCHGSGRSEVRGAQIARGVEADAGIRRRLIPVIESLILRSNDYARIGNAAVMDDLVGIAMQDQDGN